MEVPENHVNFLKHGGFKGANLEAVILFDPSSNYTLALLHIYIRGNHILAHKGKLLWIQIQACLIPESVSLPT